MQEEKLQMIRDNSALVIGELGPLSDVPSFGLNQESVAWVEEFIERQRLREGGHHGLVSTLACFLGEAIIASAGGAWTETESGDLGIRFENGAWCFPFNKVAKQFAEGRDGGDSIAGFYAVATQFVATGKLAEASRK